MSTAPRVCPDCASSEIAPATSPAGVNSVGQPLGSGVDRRDFLRTAGVASAALFAGGLGHVLPPSAAMAAAAKKKSDPETVVKLLYGTLTDTQKKLICFDWDHTEKDRGLLRTRVQNNWHITKPVINSDFYTNEQRAMIRDVFEGIIQPDWHKKIDKQLKDDAGGFGNQQNIAIFGKPGDGKFELVMTGRHMTLRCDGNTADHVAFGGPIFYGHAASGFNEKPDHPGNVFWEQALAANKVYEMLDGKQRSRALLADSPDEAKVPLQGKDGKFPGIPVKELSADQKAQMQKVLQKLIDPYRQTDRDEAVACLAKQGGLDACSLSFYKDDDIGNDSVWDNWRLEGPTFVWYFRGSPHVHVWVNIADDARVKLNSDG